MKLRLCLLAVIIVAAFTLGSFSGQERVADPIAGKTCCSAPELA